MAVVEYSTLVTKIVGSNPASNTREEDLSKKILETFPANGNTEAICNYAGKYRISVSQLGETVPRIFFCQFFSPCVRGGI